MQKIVLSCRPDIWGTGVVWPSRLLLWVSAPSKFLCRPATKLGFFSKLVRLQGLKEGLSASENFLLLRMGLLAFALFLPFSGVPRLWYLPGRPVSRGSSALNSTSGILTMLVVITHFWDMTSSTTENITHVSPKSRSCLFLKIMRPKSKPNWPRLKSDRTATWQQRRTLSH